jgi:hypothetical protein
VHVAERPRKLCHGRHCEEDGKNETKEKE